MKTILNLCSSKPKIKQLGEHLNINFFDQLNEINEINLRITNLIGPRWPNIKNPDLGHLNYFAARKAEFESIKQEQKVIFDSCHSIMIYIRDYANYFFKTKNDENPTLPSDKQIKILSEELKRIQDFEKRVTLFKEESIKKLSSFNEENLCFLENNNNVTLYLLKINEIKQKPEIDLKNKTWKDKRLGWLKIGEDRGTGTTRFVFDCTNFEHLKNAIDIAQDFQR